MIVLLLLGFVVLFIYLLPIRKKGGRWDYAPSGLVGMLFATLLTLLILGLIPGGSAAS